MNLLCPRCKTKLNFSAFKDGETCLFCSEDNISIYYFNNKVVRYSIKSEDSRYSLIANTKDSALFDNNEPVYYPPIYQIDYYMPVDSQSNLDLLPSFVNKLIKLIPFS